MKRVMVMIASMFPMLNGCHSNSDTSAYDMGFEEPEKTILFNAMKLEEARIKKGTIYIMENTRPYFFFMDNSNCILFHWTKINKKSVYCFKQMYIEYRGGELKGNYVS